LMTVLSTWLRPPFVVSLALIPALAWHADTSTSLPRCLQKNLIVST